jgi:putative ABC transport system permease protein
MLLLSLGARESFSNSISQTDLIVGPRSGSLQRLLYAVFHTGSPTDNIAYASYETFKNHPAVAWTIPYSLGDSHYGFRVVGTTEDFYSRFRYQRDRKIEFVDGRSPKGIFDVALGSDVAQTRHYQIGDRITVTHGITEGRGLLHHDDKPFRVVGILAKTATPVDRSLYITLQGVEAMHVDWADGGPPRNLFARHMWVWQSGPSSTKWPWAEPMWRSSERIWVAFRGSLVWPTSRAASSARTSGSRSGSR